MLVLIAVWLFLAQGPVHTQETPTFEAGWSSTSFAEGGSTTLTIRNTNANVTVDDSTTIVVTLLVGNNEGTADADDIQVLDHTDTVHESVPMSPNQDHDEGWLYVGGWVNYGNAKTKAMTVQAHDDDDTQETLATWVYVNGNLAGSQEITITGSPTLAATTVEFQDATHTTTEGGSGVTVTVSLDQDPDVPVTIPITTTNLGGAAGGDYSGVPATVAFSANESTKTFTVTAVDENENDDGESVRLGFGTLPLGTSATGHTTTTISLADGDGAPSDIAVSFGASSYTATEGETDASVTVTLSAAPSTAVNIPITLVSRNSGATAADHSTLPATVSFTTSDTSRTFTITAEDDTDDDDGESITLGFGSIPSGYEASGISTTTVNLDDDDSAQDILFTIVRESNLGCRVWAIEQGGETVHKTEMTSKDTIFYGYRSTSGNIERVLCVPAEVLYVDECISGTDALRGNSLRRFYTIPVEEDRTVVYAFVEMPYHHVTNPDPYLWRAQNTAQAPPNGVTGSRVLMAPYFIVRSGEPHPDEHDNPGPISIQIRHGLNFDNSFTGVTTLEYDADTSTAILTETTESPRQRIETGDRDFLVALTQRVLAIVSGTSTPTITADTNATYSISQVIGEGDFPVNSIDYCGDPTEDDF